MRIWKKKKAEENVNLFIRKLKKNEIKIYKGVPTLFSWESIFKIN